MLRNNRKLLSHFHQRCCLGFKQRPFQNPVFNNLVVLQHSHVIKKENNVLNELLDVLHLRETQLTCDTTKIQDEINRNLLTISQHTKLIQPSLTNRNSEISPKALELNNNANGPEKPKESRVKLLVEEFKILKKIRKTSKEEIADDSAIKRFNSSIKAYIDICCLSKETLPLALKMLEQVTVNEFQQKDDLPKSKKIISDVEIFTKLLLVHANDGNLLEVDALLKLMRHNNMEPSFNSYAARLVAIGQMKVMNNRLNVSNQVVRTIVEMEAFDHNALDLQTSMKYTSKEMNGIQSAMNDFIGVFGNDFPKYSQFKFKNDEDLSYKNPLIADLNTSSLRRPSGKRKYVPELSHKPTMVKNFEDQMKLEKKFLIEVPSIFNERSNNQKVSEKSKFFIRKKFEERLTKNFRAHIEQLKNAKITVSQLIYPFLTLMNETVFINLMMKEIESLAHTSQYFSPDLRAISVVLGNRVEHHLQRHILQMNDEMEKVQKIYEKYIDYKIEKNNSSEQNMLNSREQWVKIIREEQLFPNSKIENLPYEIKLLVGKFLLEEIIMKSCFIPNKISKTNKKEESAFYKIYRTTGVYRDPQLKVHPALSKIFKHSLIFEAGKLPMLTPPLPWQSPISGGYFLDQCELLRLIDNKRGEQSNLIHKNHSSNMYPVYDSLNVLSDCAWKINTTVLDYIIKIFNDNGSKTLEIPEPAHAGPNYPIKPNGKIDKKEYILYTKELNNVNKIRAEMYSEWCTMLYRLSIANMYREKVIWFPHSLDFRGRTYPIPPHFNHLGSDVARSIILFAEGKELGQNGFDMLKIHLINLTGTMKRSTLTERLAYANSIIDEIIDSAKNPFSGKLWWQNSEEKWQTLACCIEISNAINSGNPETFVSHFPIHQDGSCNGLQHYAALGRDEMGAISVNLKPSEKPQDVYSNVLDIVEIERKNDEKNLEIAALLKNQIKRKVIKQTVMTTVYNVTLYGAKLQILRQLEDHNFPKERALEASHYLATKTFQSIREIFTSAKLIQDWLSQCAYLIAYVRNKNVVWETPLGLPVVQPYQKTVKYKRSSQSTDVPDVNKQRNAFPPNYVHSLDSSHMMLTSLYCDKAGIQFVSVHDCFWTHACNADIMNRITREQFVALHSLPLLENLSDYFIKNFGYTAEEIAQHEKYSVSMLKFNKLLTDLPIKGQFDLQKVKQSTYFFS